MSQINPIHANIYHFMNIYFNIILTSMLRSSNGLFPSGFFFHQKPVRTSPLRHTCYMSRPSHYSWFQYPINILCGVKQSKLIIMYFSSIPCYLVLLRPKYSHHPTLQNTQPTILHHREWPSFTDIKKNNNQNYVTLDINHYNFGWQTGRKKILRRMITSIPWIQSALNFFLNKIFPNIWTVRRFQSNNYQSLYCSVSPAFSSRDHVLRSISIHF